MAQQHEIRLRTGPIGLLARLPWWAGLTLAAVCWLLLRHAAGSQPLPLNEPQRLLRLIFDRPQHVVAGIAQYLLPLVLIAGAAVSALRRHRRRLLLARVARHGGAALDALNWRQFELLVGEIFRRQGFRVAETGGGGADGGVDLLLKSPQREQLLVQCKHWKACAVGVTVVRELYGVIAATGAAGGFVVTSGRFTEHALEFARGLDVALVDGPRLLGLAGQAWAAAQAGTLAAPVALDPSADPARHECDHTPACGLCARPMVLRTARRGPNAGRGFWGCSGFPDCRGTRPIE